MNMEVKCNVSGKILEVQTVRLAKELWYNEGVIAEKKSNKFFKRISSMRHPEIDKRPCIYYTLGDKDWNSNIPSHCNFDSDVDAALAMSELLGLVEEVNKIVLKDECPNEDKIEAQLRREP